MDLFYGTTFEENIEAFKKDLKKVALTYGYDFGRKKLYVAYGYPEHVGNCLLVLGPPLNGDKPFQDKYSKYLFQTVNDFSLNNVVLSSCFLIPLEQVSKNDIKAFGTWTEKLVEIFRPHLVVVLGEDAQFAFVKRKNILRDTHGQIIAKTSTGVDVVLSYPMSYYLEKSEYEDPSYKDFIRRNDWEKIAKLYKEKAK